MGCGVLTGLLVPVAFRNKFERVTGPKPEPFQSIFPGVNATRTSGTGLERDRNANRNRCEQGLSLDMEELNTFLLHDYDGLYDVVKHRPLRLRRLAE